MAMILATVAIIFFGAQLLRLAGKVKHALSGRLAFSIYTEIEVAHYHVFLHSPSAVTNEPDTSIGNHITQELSSLLAKIPSLFMFDIQETQSQDLKQLLKAERLELNFMAPMVQARLKLINGKVVEKAGDKESFSREAEREQRSRNRGVNLSYRRDLLKAETLAAGKPMRGTYSIGSKDLPQLSIEERYAKRMGLKVGDIMTFDIQGLEIEGKIRNLRKVKWNTFQPNFFILFQPGVVDDAPKTF